MANMALKVVAAYLESKGLKYSIENEEDGVLRTGFNFDGGRVDILLIFRDENHVSVQGFHFAQIPQDKLEESYKLLNKFNKQYSHIKFYWDDDLEMLFAEADGVVQLETSGPECYELIQRLVAVIEDAYPQIMKAIWA